MQTSIIIKESDKESKFEQKVLPKIKERLDKSDCQLNYQFEYSEDPAFHRQRILNDMIVEATTPVVINYDCDVLLPLASYEKAYRLILDRKADLVYPYAKGKFQRQVFAENSLIQTFLDSGMSLAIFRGYTQKFDAQYGFCQFFLRDSYIEGGMENENFVSYAPEDFERHFRFKTLGYNIKRIKNIIYHIEHSRTDNSSRSNPNMASNEAEWEKIQKFNRKELWQYISDQKYYKQRMNQLKNSSSR